jgi:hypothetical protein
VEVFTALPERRPDEESLPHFVAVVASGITEIARKQTEGYAYIKP